jgi:predicted component of type VI protein secretion system
VTGLAVFLLVLLLAGGAIAAQVSAFNQIASLRQQLAALERERAQDREMLEAVLLEDAGKLRRLMGRPPV